MMLTPEEEKEAYENGELCVICGCEIEETGYPVSCHRCGGDATPLDESEDDDQ